MYTIVGDDGVDDLVLESGLSGLESSFSDLRNQKIERSEILSLDDKFFIATYSSAMKRRTIAEREHQRTQWNKALELGNMMKKTYQEASPEKKQAIRGLYERTPSPKGETISQDELEALVKDPIQHLFIPHIQVEAPLLYKLDMAIVETSDRIGFITSDAPCIWYDAEAHKRPPFYQAPALMYESIEITLPVSPRRMILFNRKGLNGYLSPKEGGVDQLNRRTRFRCYEHFIVNRNEKKDIWFDPGVEPDDSWRRTHK